MKRVEHDRANNPSPISRSVSMSGSEKLYVVTVQVVVAAKSKRAATEEVLNAAGRAPGTMEADIITVAKVPA